ncbi:MAG: hypothetical protein IJZ30_00810 [Alphaproteobacteria bacterium]|nr:hypothetical protein [Alphaproteobacteria bacterium]
MDCFEALPLAMTNKRMLIVMARGSGLLRRFSPRNDEEKNMDCFEALPLAMTKG